MNGAAFATAICIIFWNILLTVVAYKKIGIHSTIFGKVF